MDVLKVAAYCLDCQGARGRLQLMQVVNGSRQRRGEGRTVGMLRGPIGGR
jgi:hypothetical protein